MRRLCLLVLASLLLAGCCAAQASSDYDFSTLSISELYALRAQLDEAIEAIEAEESVGFYEDGTYLVGSDLPVGDYAVQEKENAMFASVVVRAGKGGEDPLILHKLISGQADIHLVRNTWVTFSEVRVWPLGAEPSLMDENGVVNEGAYLVGKQVPAGDYLVSVADKAPLSSYSVYSGIVGSGKEELIKFEVLHGETELTLETGDYVELSGATMTHIQ
jgi:hypothetical protein